MQVHEIMTDNPIHVGPDDSLVQAAQWMKTHDTGFLPVVDPLDPRRLLGVITDRDITLRAVAQDLDLSNTQVSHVMSSGPLYSIEPDMDSSDAAVLMAHTQVQRLCVVEDERFLGVVSLGDLAVTEPDQARDALQGISHGAKAEGFHPTKKEEKWEAEHP